MTESRTREPKGSATKPNPQTLFARETCPNCKRRFAVVFPLIRDGNGPGEETLFVCLDCCPPEDGA
jgi:hypothetical protein